MNQDLEHLRLLSIFHYVVAGITALFACFPMIHLTIGIVMLIAPAMMPHSPRDPPPEVFQLMGLFLTVIPGMLILAGWSLAVCILLAGRYLTQHRHYMFCMVIAALLCMIAPFGTVLGVFTIIVLVRPSVKAMFEQSVSPFGA